MIVQAVVGRVGVAGTIVTTWGIGIELNGFATFTTMNDSLASKLNLNRQPGCSRWSCGMARSAIGLVG